MTKTLTKLLTAEEFGVLPEPVDGSKLELYQGTIISMPPPKGLHGYVQLKIGALLMLFVDAHELGWTMTESGTITERDPDTVRGPEVSFYSKTTHGEFPKGYSELAPDLVVEILSPDDRLPKVKEKIREYFAAGTKLLWLVDPATKSVTVYTGNMRGKKYKLTDTLNGGKVLPGFACVVADLFGDAV